MTIAERLERAAVIAPDPIGAIQSLLYEHYNKQIGECLELLDDLRNETLIVNTGVANLFRDINSKFEAMKDIK